MDKRSSLFCPFASDDNFLRKDVRQVAWLFRQKKEKSWQVDLNQPARTSRQAMETPGRKTGNTNARERLSTVDLLIKVACF
jgi:hypothetical protein